MGRRIEENAGKECGTSAFFVAPENINAERVLFPPGEEHHIKNVLRLQNGVVLEVLDGCGGRFTVALEKKVQGLGLTGRILSAERRDQPRLRVSVALALGRRERMRIAVEKLAELGCHRIVPLVTDYVSFSGNAGKQVEKLNLVTRSALKQSRGLFLTRVDDPLGFAEFLSLVQEGKTKAVFCRKMPEEEKRAFPALVDPQGEYFLAVGPEGGFSPRENAMIEKSGAPCLHLGESDLRFETAAIAGFVLLRQALAGEFSLYRKEDVR